MNALELTPPLFAILSSLIEERVGLCYGPQDRDLLASKLSSRAQERGFESLLDYYYFLRYDPESAQELEELTDNLVVNETFFFREFAPLQVVVSQLLVPLVRDGQRPRVWCAACSTGEEPLTLAMLLEEQGILSRVNVLATDISMTALRRAQRGHFGRRSLRHIPSPTLASRWLEHDENGVNVAPELQDSIVWQQMNLLDDQGIASLGSFDVILCRNVLIYFRDQVVTQVVHRLQERLRPGGALVVGVSESLMRFSTSLICEERAGVFIYRKPST